MGGTLPGGGQAPPQLSDDGRWYWNGRAWVPVPELQRPSPTLPLLQQGRRLGSWPAPGTARAGRPNWTWWKVAPLVVIWPAGLIYLLVRLWQSDWPSNAKVGITVVACVLTLVTIASAESGSHAPATPSASRDASTAPATPELATPAPPTHPPSTPAARKPDDLARMLAQQDGSSDVAAYHAALDQLQPACSGNRAYLATLADAGLEDLQKNGIRDETRLTVLHHLRASIPPSAGKTDCRAMLAAYLVEREG